MSNCPVCENSESKRFKNYYTGEPKLFECLKCGFIFHNESVINDEDELSYERFYYSGRKKLQPHREKNYRDILKKILQLNLSGKKLLDVGCRDGHFLSICKEFNF